MRNACIPRHRLEDRYPQLEGFASCVEGAAASMYPESDENAIAFVRDCQALDLTLTEEDATWMPSDRDEERCPPTGSIV